jgi:sarcosine oxidase, subunit gamma
MVESLLAAAPPAPPVGVRRGSPAAHLEERFAAAEVRGVRAVRLREVPFLTMVGLRSAPGSAGAERLRAALGSPLPSACGSVTTGDAGSVLWLSPDEFLVVSDEPPAPLASRLRAALGDGPGSVVDLSANRTTFELAGASARATLEKGCPLDLHPRAFEIGTAYVTLLGSVPVVLWRVGEELYRILPRSSYADFLGRWLLDATAEFAAPEPV